MSIYKRLTNLEHPIPLGLQLPNTWPLILVFCFGDDQIHASVVERLKEHLNIFKMLINHCKNIAELKRNFFGSTTKPGRSHRPQTEKDRGEVGSRWTRTEEKWEKKMSKTFPRGKLVRNHTHMKARADMQTHTLTHSFGIEQKWVIREGHQGNRQTQATVRRSVCSREASTTVALYAVSSTHHRHHYLKHTNMKTTTRIFYLEFSKRWQSRRRMQATSFLTRRFLVRILWERLWFCD